MYYVYDLIDPRTETTFYVGKGQGKRLFAHFKDAKKGVVGLKCDLIRAIYECGLEPEAKVIKEFVDEDKAFAFEKKRIAKFGLENLTNIACGGREMSVEDFELRRTGRGAVRGLARLARLYATCSEIWLNFGGKRHPISKDSALKMLSNGVRSVIKVFGHSEAKALFSRHNISLENKA